MSGRDPDEPHRTASPLELLFDLTFVVAVGTASANFADAFVEGHEGTALLAGLLAMFAISLAWINYSWFASAFSTDDWLDRLLTMLQMIGVVVFALGIPPMFRSVVADERFEIRLLVFGYVVMRIAMVLQWWRASRQSASFRRVARINIAGLIVAQAGWIAVALARPHLAVALVFFVLLAALELLLPVFAQGGAGGTPWHPHHVAERYSAFVIIALGEGVVGTVASSAGLLGGDNGLHWTGNGIAVAVAGVGLTFGLWWVYFSVQFGEMLSRRRGLGYVFGYGHFLIFVGIAGAGAGLHIIGLEMEHHADIGPVTTIAALVIPVAVYLVAVYALYTVLLGELDPFHLVLIVVTTLILVLAVVLAVVDVPVAVCLIVVMVAPFVSVVGYELVGNRHQQTALARTAASE
ncbi:low temperature requirement protein A [Jongsikchunia kroppenstedtii]|uniref:low temperature requirement protein A n=1 Tax=Jongsikchunia kroppenstedtii TaxID=1121721 RepID=UPI00037057C6|nr:low temperature requirement protein A [Jongsikchunia kroppenstedtii]